MTDAGGGPYPFDWARLVPLVIHPLRVSIIETLAWVGRPLSASELALIFSDDMAISLVSYHVTELRKAGVLEPVGHRHVRGARQTFYWFTSDDK